MNVTTNGQPPVNNSGALTGTAPTAPDKLKGALGTLGGTLGALLQGLSPTDAKQLEASTLQTSQSRDVLETAHHHGAHQVPGSSDPNAVMGVMIDPTELQEIAQKLGLLPGTLSTLQNITNNSITSANPTDSDLQVSAAAHQAEYDKQIASAAHLPAGSQQQAMFSAAAIELACVFADIAQMKKGLAKEFATASIQAMQAMIDGAHDQAKLEEAKGQAEAQSAFMSAALQGIGAAVSFLGAARSLQIGAKKIEAVDEFNVPRKKDKVNIMVTDPLSSGKMQAVSQMWQSFSQLFSQVGTSMVEGQKAQEVGHIEAQKVVISNAMQILGQMMSKWGDEEKAAHDAVSQLADAMNQMMEKLVFSSKSIGPS